MSKNTAVILAGGSGSRMGYELPKQFLKVAGKSILEHTVNAFEIHPLIDEIAIVVHPEFIDLVEQQQLKNKWTKLKKILRGGEQRSDSSLAAINAFRDQKDVNLIFHDAVRPLVSQRIITDNIEALKKYDAVDTAVPSADTIIRLESKMELIDEIPEREFLRKGQTPQSFRFECISKAYEIGLKDLNFKATDDCGIVRKYLPDTKIFVVSGDQQNIKLTYKEDIFLVDKLFQLKSAEISSGFDISALKDKVIVIFGGSEGIGAEIVKICNSNQIKIYPFSRSLNQTDVCNPNDVKSALENVFQKEGKIDCVINTAGLLIKNMLSSLDDNEVDRLLDVNLKGVVVCAREAYPYLKKSKGSFLSFTSSSYTRGRAFYSLYSATKAAIVNFTQAIAEEWEADGIRANCINPERTKTGMRTKNFGFEPDDSLLMPDRVAMVALNVLSGRLNGQVVDVKVNDKK
ncbi:MAG: bifunctional cytidylyltransferase/SDR family oxidoreductase [Moheibacter sp.]